jgi:2-aminoethylphosphonate-pyruvate transaminase
MMRPVDDLDRISLPPGNTLPQNPYLLLTPGPLSTTQTVKEVMLKDWCTWDDDYNQIVQRIRHQLVRLATTDSGYTAVLMQGSGTFSVEAVLSSVIGPSGKLLVLTNGIYGKRLVTIARRHGIDVVINDSGEVHPPDLNQLKKTLRTDPSITHVAVVHCETTTGMLNPVAEIGDLVKSHELGFIVDAMSSFGGIPMDISNIQADFLISSANKCIQGVPGFGFVIALRSALEQTAGYARTLSLDLYDQWREMEDHAGKWRFTSPTHTVRAFGQAIEELQQEGGIAERYKRYVKNQQILVNGMRELGFQCLLPDEWQSPFITAFLSPDHPAYRFDRFYRELKQRKFVIYPGTVTEKDTFRIGNIGNVYPEDMHLLIEAVRASCFWKA